MQSLLTGSALLQLAARDTNPMQAWLNAKRMSQFRMSVIGIGMARSAIDFKHQGLLRERWRQSLDHRVNTLQAEGGRAIAIDEGTIEKWQSIRRMDLQRQGAEGPEQVAQDIRLEIAVALALGLALVEPVQPYHDQLRAVGMSVQSIT